MISITRSSDAATLPVYLKKSVKGAGGVDVSPHERERADAIAFFADPAHFAGEQKLTAASFSFKVFKDKALAEILARDFLGKCAYCESNFAAVTPSDIEHFRPKSSIVSKDGELKPGYYWLAGEWENLLISCPDCNRVRKHSVPGQSKQVALGKGSQFPLSDATVRVRHHDHDIAAEQPACLLLHPCLDRPENHIVFDAEGLVRPVGQGAGASEKGRISIDVYALQRKHLVEARRGEVARLREKVDTLIFLVRQHNALAAVTGDTAGLRADNAAEIEKCLASIKAMMVPSAEYVAAKRDWLRAADAAGEFSTLATFGIEMISLARLTG